MSLFLLFRKIAFFFYFFNIKQKVLINFNDESTLNNQALCGNYLEISKKNEYFNHYLERLQSLPLCFEFTLNSFFFFFFYIFTNGLKMLKT